MCLRWNSDICREQGVCIFSALQSLRRQFEGPCDDQRDGKANHDSEHDETHGPGWNFEEGKNLRGNLNQEPANDRVSDGHLINVAPLELGEEVIGLHWVEVASFGANEATICSKRGSPRSGSQKGNSLSMP